MLVRRLQRVEFWLAAGGVALVALALGGRRPDAEPEAGQSPGTRRQPTSTAEGPTEEPHRLSGERIIADPLVLVGFRSRTAAEPQPDPEVSLGTEVEMPPSGATARAQVAGPQSAPSPQVAPPAMTPVPAYGPIPPQRPSAAVPVRIASLPPAGPGMPPGAFGGPVLEDRGRTVELEMIARQTDALVKHGYRLAERGAVYSARQHFLEALALVARTLDLAGQNQMHTRALAEGNTALIEARQLSAPAGTRVDLARIVAAHHTPILKAEPLDSLSPVVAQQRYLTFAQERLTQAAGGWPAASLALYALGKEPRRCSPPVRSARWPRWASKSPVTRPRSGPIRKIIWRPTSWA